VLDVDDDTTVMISQLACTEPGCPPIETVVAVLSPGVPPRRWTLHLPVEQITTDDLSAMLTTPPEGA
jgi:hypothetical protein